MYSTSRLSRALSFESFATSSTSNTASTDTSTIWGPGTLSGKAIEAFGEATLRGVENVVIRRKLSTYRSLFPHTDDMTIKNIDTVYENVLELSRYSSYPFVPHVDGCHTELTAHCTDQISTPKIRHRLLCDWWWCKSQDGRHFVYAKVYRNGRWSNFNFFYPRSWTCQCVRLMSVWKLARHFSLPSSQYTYTSIRNHDVSGKGKLEALRDAIHLTPVIDFIVVVADHSDLACQAAVDAGFLDFMLRIYAVFPRLERGTPDLVSACTSTLLIVSRQSDCLEAIIRHPVCLLWKKCSQPFHDDIPDVADDPVSIRRLSWSRTEKLCIMSRLVTIYSLISTSRLKETVAIHMCVDLVEFARWVFIW